MEITCPRCRSRHLVDPPSSGRARSRPLRFRCSECGNTFPLQGDSVGLPPAMLPIEPPSRHTPEPRVAAPGEPVEMLRVGGDVYSVPDLATLQRWILEGRATRHDRVSQHGMRWTALGERPDFAVFFSAADAVGGRGTTLAPTDSPVRQNPSALPMADDEEIYVHEVGPGEAAPTSFVGSPPAPEEAPAAEEAPTLQDLPMGPEAAAPSLELSDFAYPAADAEHDERPTRVDTEAPEPVDELPAEMLIPPRRFVDNPDDLRKEPGAPAFRAEALSLGFQLGPDPDTQEATMEETRQSDARRAASAELTENFMRTGVLPPAEPELGPVISPPPVILPDGRVPRTRAPAAPRSILDDDFDEPAPGPRMHLGPEVFIGGALLLAVLIAVGGWFLRPTDPAPAEPGGEAVAAAEPPAAAAEPEAATEAAEPEAATEAEAARARAAQVAADRAEAAAAARAEAEADAKARAAEKATAKAKADAERKAAAPARPVAAAAPAKPAPAAADPSKAGGSAKQLTDQGWKAMDKGDAETAHGYFARALQKSPTNAAALYGRGYANEKLGDKVSAHADYCAALENAGTDTELTRELTGNLRRLGSGCSP